MSSCKICSEKCPTNNRLMDRNFREKGQDIFGLMINPPRTNTASVCDNCESKINRFYTFKHMCRQHIHNFKNPDVKPINSGFAIRTEIENVISGKAPESEMQENRLSDDDDDDGLPPLQFDIPKEKKRYGPPLKRNLVRFTKEQLATKTKKELYFERYQIICEQCGKSVNHNHLESHMNGHRGIKPYKCSETDCGAAFKCRSALSAHIRRNHSNDQYPCTKCGKICASALSLKSHMISHRERNIECEICGLKVLTKSVLEVHMRVHTQKRDYQCPYCPKAFYVNSVLTLHLRSHTGEKPYVCHVCDFASAHRILYVKHMQKFHPAEPIYKLQEMQKFAAAGEDGEGDQEADQGL